MALTPANAAEPGTGDWGMDFEVRAATPADAAELARLRYAFRAERHPPLEPESAFLKRSTEWMLPRLEQGSVWRCWIATSPDRLVGTLWLQIIEKLPNPGDEPEHHGYISSVYVDPRLRNRGIGSALIAAALQECEVQELDAVFLWSTPDSRRLYQRNGFATRDDYLDRR